MVAPTVTGRTNTSGTRGGVASISPLPLATKDYDHDNEEDFRRKLAIVITSLRQSQLQAGVLSVFGRIGDVIAVLHDYDASQVDNDSSVSGSTVKDALNTLLASIASASSAALLKASNLSDLANATTARSNLGVAIGSQVQAWDAMLDALAALTAVADRGVYFTGADAVALYTFTSFARTLLAGADAAAMRSTLITEKLGVVRGLSPQTSNYVLVLGDAGETVEMNLAGANTLTVPPNSSVAFETGTYVNFTQVGAGQTTLTPGAGVTIRAAGAALKTAKQWAMGTLYKRATDEWVAGGNLST